MVVSEGSACKSCGVAIKLKGVGFLSRVLLHETKFFDNNDCLGHVADWLRATIFF